MTIHGVYSDGVWVDDPGRVKDEFKNFYQYLFSRQKRNRPKTDPSSFSSLLESHLRIIYSGPFY